jgi:hypothetical protein
VIDHLRKTTGIEARRVHVDRGYRGHAHTNSFSSGSPADSGT